MKVLCASIVFSLALMFASFALAGTWVDEFEGKELGAEWTIRDRPGDPSQFEVKDGKLSVVCTQNFGHMEADRPLALIEAPEGDFSAMGLFSSDPEKPTNAWHGIFVLGDDPLQFACLLFGGESNQPQKTLIGSMVKANWQDKGHFPTGFDVPLYLKLERKGKQWTGYCKKSEKEDWTLIGQSWIHDFEPKWVGVGFINNWGGKVVTLIVDSFAVEGPNVKPRVQAVDPGMKLLTLWSALKER
jgi:hypothetical protein